jgi:acyl carrier protein
VAGVLSRLSGVALADIDRRTPLSEYGIDSIVSRRLLQEIEKTYAVTLGSDALLEFNSIDALAAHIAQLPPSQRAAPIEAAQLAEADSVDGHAGAVARESAPIERALEDFRGGHMPVDALEALLDEEFKS